MPRLVNGYTISPATHDDVSALVQIDRAAATLFAPTGLLSPSALFDYVPATVFSDALAIGHVHVMRDGDAQPVGFTLTSGRGRGLYLDQISVHPDHGRQGLGRSLMLRVLQNAEERHLPIVTLSTFRDVPWNAPFYASMGFKEIVRDKLDPFMLEIERAQSEFMEVTKRCFMQRRVRRPLFRFSRSA